MNLFLITYDYPFGTGETFLETEIKVLQHYFERIVVVSTSQNYELTRDVPNNVIAVKCDRRFAMLRCGLYAFCKLFSAEFYREFQSIRHIENRPSIMNMIKGCIKAWGIEKRLEQKVREMRLDTQNMIAYSYWLSEGAYFLAKHKNMWKKTVSRAHGYEVRDYEQYLPFRGLIDKEIGEIHFISGFTESSYERIMNSMRIGKRRATHYISRLGVEVPNFLDSNAATMVEQEIVVVSCSSIYRLKRLDLIVEMLEKYSGSTPIRWIHFGWGEMGEEIKNLCEQKLSKKNNVLYELRGWVENAKVIDFYKHHRVDLFVNASDSEGIPVSIMEAMSFGIPCMARNVGGMAEIIVNHVNGYLLPEKPNVEEMISVLEEITKGEVGLSRKDIYNWCREHYDSETNYRLFCESIVKIRK